MKKHKKDIIQLGVLLLMLIGLIFGKSLWNRFFTSDKYGFQYNEERVRLGILPIPAGWDHSNDFTSSEEEEDERERRFWTPSSVSFTDGKAKRTMKMVNVLNGRIKNETDFIRNQQGEELAINYQYDSVGQWKYTFSRKETKNIPHVITRQEADSILHAWDIKEIKP